MNMPTGISGFMKVPGQGMERAEQIAARAVCPGPEVFACARGRLRLADGGRAAA